MKTLQSAVIKTEPIAWRSLQFLQQDNFKDLSDTAKQKLKTSLLANQFSQPFYVWQDPKTGTICSSPVKLSRCCNLLPLSIVKV